MANFIGKVHMQLSWHTRPSTGLTNRTKIIKWYQVFFEETFILPELRYQDTETSRYPNIWQHNTSYQAIKYPQIAHSALSYLNAGYSDFTMLQATHTQCIEVFNQPITIFIITKSRLWALPLKKKFHILIKINQEQTIHTILTTPTATYPNFAIPGYHNSIPDVHCN